MLFNTYTFAIFFAITFAIYVCLNHKRQNVLLLLASYIFYGWWDWRFLGLIALSTVVDYICGHKIYNSSDPKYRKAVLIISVCTNLGVLFFFKYFNFFADSLGFDLDPVFSEIILPVGISFYTFQTMTYTIDIYRKELKPAGNFFDFALFVAFFPQLVAGPIERAKRLLPQILEPRKLTLNGFYEGSFLIFWGLYQKVFIADNLAKIVNPVFAKGAPYECGEVLIALYAFAFQIFCDFAGYSTIARGLAKCLGFELMVNFNIPYFAVSPSDFWHRWHISLSTWLRDYLYIPLGGNRHGTINTLKNLMITMILGGLWHGAAWGFVIWGFYHGLLLVIYRLLEPLSKMFTLPSSSLANQLVKVTKIFIFFHLVCLGWLFFRAPTLERICEMLSGLFSNFSTSHFDQEQLSLLILTTLVLTAVQIAQYRYNDLMIIYKSNIVVRVMFYIICYASIVSFGVMETNEFIYFQF